MIQKRALLALIGLATILGCSDDPAPGGTAGTGTPTAGGMAVGMAGTSAAAGSGGSTAAGSSAAGTGIAGAAAGRGAAGMTAAGTGAAGMSTAGSSAGTGATAGTGAAGMPAGGASGMAAGGAGAAGAAGGMSSAEFKLTSPVVMDGMMIPKEYRGASPSPALTWTAGPANTKSYAIVFKDVTPGFSMNYMHWVIYDIPATTMMLPMGVPTDASITTPVAAKQAPNYTREPGYIGPGAPAGTNMYRFTLYALSVDALPGVTASSTGAQVEMALEGASKLASTPLNITSAP